MTDQGITTHAGDLPTPVVFERAGKVCTTSREVAELFGKRHDNVLRDIDGLIAAEPTCLLNFEETPYLETKTRQAYRQYEIDRDGFALLAMGFTGAKAMKFKLAYIAAFKRMEEALSSRSIVTVDLGDPEFLLSLVTSYAQDKKALLIENHAMKETVEAFDRIATADGSLCVTDAAKTLQVQPKVLFGFLRSHGWIYTRAGGGDEIAYQGKLASGLMEHKTTTVHRSDGSERIRTQVRVTPKGLSRLARELLPVATAA